ncbi:hypothetical protein MNEG_3553 [Monoraphidium neglectum]|uniref:Uncharacterized protein n=1 Tax=Monoraphidium neglectum TaxID=145388 RepID=A0A0D2NHA9_9CHLO|nr:hypothetical protein MNEG_3553 [Monoraphidium neglectum]KIZ04406.1 hypothetical protein MNEG_3553 [Monoraphidium neglectum]|eukprot:XP_013903425.1 hypothetical protein MNEG_3553 [Monoraphidium neglectum]
MFGAAVINNTAYYSGGLDANNPTYPPSGSFLEAVDLGTLAPRTLPTVPDAQLNTSRYRQQLAPWGDDRIIMVGGQFDDRNGVSQKAMTMVTLDVANRTWQLKRSFWQGNGETRKGNDLLGSGLLAPSILFLQLQVVAGTALDSDAKQLLIWQSERSIARSEQLNPPDDSIPAVIAIVFDTTILESSLPCGVSIQPNGLKHLNAGEGGTILSSILTNTAEGLHLYLWSNTNGTFEGRKGLQRVQVLTRFALDISVDNGGFKITHTPVNVFIAVPPTLKLAQLLSVDLPLLGSVVVSEAEIASGLVAGMPYVGDVELVNDLDNRNIVINEIPGGLIFRGNSKPNDKCVSSSETPTSKKEEWAPFIMTIRLSKGKPASFRATAANTWCATASSLDWVTKIQQANLYTKGMRGLHGVNAPGGGKQLMLVSPRFVLALGYFPGYADGGERQEPVQGAFIDVSTRAITQFTAKPPKGYSYPQYVAACVTRPAGGAQVYIEYGGAIGWGVPKRTVLNNVAAMPVPFKAGATASISPVGGAAGLPRRAHAAMACAPDGRAWVFGGLEDVGNKEATKWAPTNDLSAFALKGGAGAFSLTASSSKQPAKPTAFAVAASAAPVWPGVRYGAGMVFLPPSVAGTKAGALVLFGGSSGNDPELLDINNMTKSPLLGDTWLYDVAAASWWPLRTAGAPPPAMMWHAMAVDGRSVLLYGGRVMNATTDTWALDSNVYALEFPESGGLPSWRSAPVRNQNRGTAPQTDFPNTAIVPIAGQIALQREMGC